MDKNDNFIKFMYLELHRTCIHVSYMADGMTV